MAFGYCGCAFTSNFKIINLEMGQKKHKYSLLDDKLL